jgi:hypothetical protein
MEIADAAVCNKILFSVSVLINDISSYIEQCYPLARLSPPPRTGVGHPNVGRAKRTESTQVVIRPYHSAGCPGSFAGPHATPAVSTAV